MSARTPVLVLEQPDETAAVDELHTEISKTLSAIATDAGFLVALHDSSSPGLGFLTPTALDRIDEGVRADAAERARRHTESHVVLREGAAPVHGYTAAPGRVPAISLTAAIVVELHRLARALVVHLASRGVCTLHRPPRHGAPVAELTGYLRRLAMDVATTRPLAAALESLDHINATLREHLDGERESFLPGTCPHCGRVTLVVYFTDHQVRCGRERTSSTVQQRDPATGELTDVVVSNTRRAGRHFQPCVCPDPLCGCKVDAVAHRHTWHLNKPGVAPDSYTALARHLNANPDPVKAPRKKDR